MSIEEPQARVGRDEQLEELEALRAEVVRLRLDVLAARDAARGAEAALGQVEGYCRTLEAEVVRLQRDHEWFRHEVVARLRRLRGSWSTTRRRIGR